MKLQDTHFDNAETGCCAKLDRALWDSRELEWNNKLFLRDHIRSFLHIPLNFGSVISRDNAAIEEAEAYPLHPVWLTDEVSPWGADVYVAVDREVPGKPMRRSGDLPHSGLRGSVSEHGPVDAGDGGLGSEQGQDGTEDLGVLCDVPEVRAALREE